MQNHHLYIYIYSDYSVFFSIKHRDIPVRYVSHYQRAYVYDCMQKLARNWDITDIALNKPHVDVEKVASSRLTNG